MRIKEIELDNFKSFGKPTVVPILDGFTTISGPNGSGKSNIVDSLLFALGLSSTRSMRAERLPDLLNNLSGKNEAKVTVRFTNDLGDELEVSRRIRVKDNGYTSTYQSNGKNCTLTDIHDELMRYNVSPTGFNVIMQGDVTGIVSMSGSERRKIIDELAGVAEFDRRIEQATEELNSVGEKIEHQRIILAEILARLEILRGDRDQALKYLDYKSQKEALEKDLIFVRAQELEAKVKSALEELEKLDAKEEKLLGGREQAEISLVTLRAEMGQIEQEIKEKGGNEQLLLRQELETKRGELTRQENKLSNLNGVIGEKTKLLKSIQDQIKAIDKHLSGLIKEKKQHLEDQKAVENALKEKRESYSTSLARIEELRQHKDRSSDQATSMHLDLQKLRDERHKHEVRRTELLTRKEGIEKELEQLRETATNSIAKSAQTKGLIQSSERKYQDHEALVLGIERSVQQMEAEIASTNEEIDTKREAIEAISRRLIELETHREVAGQSGFGKAVEAILESGIAGVHGTIGQLGKVDEKYTIAMETTIGQRLGHIVVEDDQVAQECITFLKKNQAGRATFVPLNKIVTQPPGLLPNKPGVIDFAYNLINFNPKYVKAFQYACGQTIIVEDMEVARKLINQARMATLQGELFDKSGSITGGNDTKNRMHLSKGETDLATLKQTRKTYKEQLASLQLAVKELTVALSEERLKANDARAELATKFAELDGKRKEANNLDQEVEAIKPRLRSSGDEIDEIDKNVVEIDAAMKKLNKEITKQEESLGDVTSKNSKSTIQKLIAESEDLRQMVEGVDNQFAEIQRQIDRIETEERVEQNTRDGLTNQLELLNLEITEVGTEKPTLEASVAELTKNIQEMEQKVTSLSEELESLRDKKDAIHDKVTAIEIERTKAEQDLLHLEEQRQKHKLAHFDLDRELSDLRAEIERIMTENPNYQPPDSGTVEQLRSQVERLEKKMRALEPVNMKALEEYNQTDERQKELNEHLDTLSKEREEIMQRIAGYDELKKRTFMEAFDAINTNFQEIFAELSHGHGRLELENPENPFAGGLIIRAQPRDKKMQRIEALSGGEKSLTALSFVFAFQRFAPAPFYAFDEVDMMLDGSNAERLAQMVKRQSASAQFVVVSLRRPMIENADQAIGVSLRADGYSRVVGINEIQIPDEQEQAVGA